MVCSRSTVSLGTTTRGCEMKRSELFATGTTGNRVNLRRLLGVSIGAIVLFGATACGSSSDSSSVDSAVEATTAIELPTTLSVSIGSEPGSLDPLLKSDGPRDTFGLSVYEGLTIRVGDASGSEIVPNLASSYELDGTACIFKLREGVLFHN